MDLLRVCVWILNTEHNQRLVAKLVQVHFKCYQFSYNEYTCYVSVCALTDVYMNVSAFNLFQSHLK